MILYGSYISPFSARVMIQIRAKNLNVPMVEAPDGVHSDTYRRINPLGKIPALEVDGRVIPESAVICEYLEARYPEPTLLGADAEETASIRLLARIADLYVMNAMLPLFAQLNPKTRDEAVVRSVVEAVSRGLGFLDRFIAPGPYAVGARLTLADAAAAPFLFYVTRFLPMVGAAEPLAPVERVAAYWAQIERDPRVKAVLDAMREALNKLR